MQDRDTLWIGGEWVASEGDQTIEVISPHTEEVIATVPEASTADVDKAVAAARAAFDSGPWAQMGPAERADLLASLTAALGARSQDLAETITAEMGSPIMFSHLGQVGATMMVLDYFTNLTRDFAFEEERQGLMSSVLVRREPVGVVGAVVPWNVPLFVTMLKLAPALAAGCTMVLKPAPETPLDSYLLAEVLEEAGVPAGVVNIVAADREVGEHLVRHPDIDKISFTGSTAAGRKIGAIAGEQLKRVTLELGGKSAAIILDDANLDETLPTLMQFSLMNNGQACVAQTRILAPRSRYAEIRDALAEAVGNFKVGDPLDMATECGPLVAERQRERVE
ncbi:MAG: aldehyde dehydrogenase family protein, partial [Acidimicrobiales bacterium]